MSTKETIRPTGHLQVKGARGSRAFYALIRDGEWPPPAQAGPRMGQGLGQAHGPRRREVGGARRPQAGWLPDPGRRRGHAAHAAGGGPAAPRGAPEAGARDDAARSVRALAALGGVRPRGEALDGRRLPQHVRPHLPRPRRADTGGVADTRRRCRSGWTPCRRNGGSRRRRPSAGARRERRSSGCRTARTCS